MRALLAAILTLICHFSFLFCALKPLPVYGRVMTGIVGDVNDNLSLLASLCNSMTSSDVAEKSSRRCCFFEVSVFASSSSFGPFTVNEF